MEDLLHDRHVTPFAIHVADFSLNANDFIPMPLVE